MPRKGRRDCRKAETKKNHINKRVEALQQSIRKSKKSDATKATASGESQAAASSSSLTPAAASFLSQMRADVQKEVAATKETYTGTAAKKDAT